MKVVVVGGGVAGKTCALLLEKLPQVKSVVLLEASSSFATTCSSHFYTGIWTQGYEVLQSVTGKRGRQEGFSTTYSGYRDTSGNWLVSSPNGLIPTPGKSFLIQVGNES